MCRRCNFLCCDWKGHSSCGCSDCTEPYCWELEEDDEDTTFEEEFPEEQSSTE